MNIAKVSRIVGVGVLLVSSMTYAKDAKDSAKDSKDPWTSHYYTVADGTKLHYVEMGKGTPVILIHGAGGSAVGNWFRNGIAPALAKTNRVIGIDMRGHALSEAGPPGGRQYMARDVLEFMAQQKIEKAHIGGYSMGGGVTLSLLASNPEKFITASFQGSGIGETAEWRDKIPKDKEGTDPEADKARQLYDAARAARGESARGEAVGNNRADIARLAQGAAPAGDNPAMQERVRERQAMMDKLDLTKIKFPVMAVNGEFDRPIAKTHRLWRELDNFTNLVLPGKGHLSAVMEGLIPQQYVDGYRDFIVANNPPAPAAKK
jgi:pimeloyl-ACP methyl ester carboxylesterase